MSDKVAKVVTKRRLYCSLNGKYYKPGSLVSGEDLEALEELGAEITDDEKSKTAHLLLLEVKAPEKSQGSTSKAHVDKKIEEKKEEPKKEDKEEPKKEDKEEPKKEDKDAKKADSKKDAKKADTKNK